jgi:gamma-glutamylcyclotransferase (GGCT)/AIG2-like uncharacterized protein YtfP
MPLLFSYGTLQRDDVQRSTFGRLLTGQKDELRGYEQLPIIIDGRTYATIRFNGSEASRVAGIVFEITDSELARADEYEGDFYYKRIAVTLASGKKAWVYVSTTSAA